MNRFAPLALGLLVVGGPLVAASIAWHQEAEGWPPNVTPERVLWGDLPANHERCVGTDYRGWRAAVTEPWLELGLTLGTGLWLGGVVAWRASRAGTLSLAAPATLLTVPLLAPVFGVGGSGMTLGLLVGVIALSSIHSRWLRLPLLAGLVAAWTALEHTVLLAGAGFVAAAVLTEAAGDERERRPTMLDALLLSPLAGLAGYLAVARDRADVVAEASLRALWPSLDELCWRAFAYPTTWGFAADVPLWASFLVAVLLFLLVAGSAGEAGRRLIACVPVAVMSVAVPDAASVAWGWLLVVAASRPPATYARLSGRHRVATAAASVLACGLALAFGGGGLATLTRSLHLPPRDALRVARQVAALPQEGRRSMIYPAGNAPTLQRLVGPPVLLIPGDPLSFVDADGETARTAYEGAVLHATGEAREVPGTVFVAGEIDPLRVIWSVADERGVAMLSASKRWYPVVATPGHVAFLARDPAATTRSETEAAVLTAARRQWSRAWFEPPSSSAIGVTLAPVEDEGGTISSFDRSFYLLNQPGPAARETYRVPSRAGRRPDYWRAWQRYEERIGGAANPTWATLRSTPKTEDAELAGLCRDLTRASADRATLEQALDRAAELASAAPTKHRLEAYVAVALLAGRYDHYRRASDAARQTDLPPGFGRLLEHYDELARIGGVEP